MNAERPASVGDLVKRARLEKGLTQAELAEQVGKGQNWVSSLERGEIQLPRRPVINQLSRILDIPIPDFYLAAQMAETRADATRIDDALPKDEPTDPDLRMILWGSPKLTANQRKSLAALVRSIINEEPPTE